MPVSGHAYVLLAPAHATKGHHCTCGHTHAREGPHVLPAGSHDIKGDHCARGKLPVSGHTYVLLAGSHDRTGCRHAVAIHEGQGMRSRRHAGRVSVRLWPCATDRTHGLLPTQS